jgi:hypothetical protein
MSGTLVTAEMTEIKHVSNVKKLNHSLPLCQNIVNGIIECSNEILGWEGVGNRQLLCFFKV